MYRLSQRQIILTAAVVWISVMTTVAEAAVLTRGPYLQQLTSNSVIVRWRTDVPTDSVVTYHAVSGSSNPTLTAHVPGSRTEHEVQLTGLTADTGYIYDVGSTSEILPSSCFLHTARVTSGGSFNISVYGNSGPGTAAARRTQKSGPTNMLLLLGDNAYSDGTDEQYQHALFDPTMNRIVLCRSVTWPTFGNRDGQSSNSTSDTGTGPYYDIFTLPINGELGGVASNTEAYYSFDYGNAHFVSLNTYDVDRSPGSPMLNWLQSDLASTTQKWKIVFFHHSPYSKGWHDSDITPSAIEVRQNILPILEQNGVDLVLSAHSYSFERSRFIYGHYGDSSTYSRDDHVVVRGDGKPVIEDGDGRYYKTDHRGTVYAVVGSSGESRSGPLNHPAMSYSSEKLGFGSISVGDETLKMSFIAVSEAGNNSIPDEFVIAKPNLGHTPPVIESPNRTVTIGTNGQVKLEIHPPTPTAGTCTDMRWTRISGPHVFQEHFMAIDEEEDPRHTYSGTFRSTGKYVLRIYCDDGVFTVSDDVTITVKPRSNGIRILQQPVLGAKGDGHETATGAIEYEGEELILGNNQWAGTRFRDLPIPRGATITKAHVEFTSYNPTGTPMGEAVLSIYAHDTDDAPNFEDLPTISGRPRLPESLTWSPEEWLTHDSTLRESTPDISHIIQAIVDRDGWESGNALALLYTGTGTRRAFGYWSSLEESSIDSYERKLPRLYIEYQ